MSGQMIEENILEIRGLTKSFGGLTAVDHVDIVVKKGTVHSLVGPNGAGKTTTLSMINGTLPATSGQVFFDGKEITHGNWKNIPEHQTFPHVDGAGKHHGWRSC